MKKILLILFVLIFNFSYSKDLGLEKALTEAMFRQSTSFSECFKVTQDFEKMSELLQKYVEVDQEMRKLQDDLTVQKKSLGDEDIIPKFFEALTIAQLLESKIDHLYYYHASDIPADIDLISLKKHILQNKGQYQFYINIAIIVGSEKR